MTSMLRLYSRSGSCVQIDLLDNSGQALCSLGQAAHRLRVPKVGLSAPIAIGIALPFALLPSIREGWNEVFVGS